MKLKVALLQFLRGFVISEFSHVHRHTMTKAATRPKKKNKKMKITAAAAAATRARILSSAEKRPWLEKHYF